MHNEKLNWTVFKSFLESLKNGNFSNFDVIENE